MFILKKETIWETVVSLFIRRILFACYVFFVQLRRGNKASGEKPTPIFTWRHAYFLFWHRFFWRMGRGFLSVFTDVKQLRGDLLSPTAYEYYIQFNEMCARDRENRPFTERIMRQKSFPLADDTVRALCLFYKYHIHIAPWQYGLEMRKRACAHMAGAVVVSIFLFLFALFLNAQKVLQAPWIIWFIFFVSLFAVIGLFASHCILDIAREAEKMFNKHKSP